MEDEIDIELRSAKEVALRAVAVAAVLQRVALEDLDVRNDLDVAGEAFDIREWIVTEQISHVLTASEARILKTSIGEISHQDRRDLSWQAEALVALLWTLGAKELSATAPQTELAALLDHVPHPWDRVSGWVERARLRPESEIAHERELADIWYWRLGAEIERRNARSSERPSYELAIHEVVAEAAAAGYLVDAKRGDFTVSGRLVRDLDSGELSKLAATAEERLRSFNWVSGFGSTWDDVPIEV